MNISEVLAEGKALLREVGVPEASKEASLLLVHALKRDQTFLIAHPEHELATRDKDIYESFIHRRASREPFQYIVGREEFFGLEFEITPDVLIPRPETEFLVESAVKFLNEIESPRFCEIGTGSGCISIALLHEVPSATAVAGDISAEALKVAGRNAARNNVADRLELIVSDVFQNVPNETFDAVLSNPPYVPIGDLASLQAEVRDFEPRVALAGGDDGLLIIKQIVEGASKKLRPGGRLAIEIGFGQADKVQRLFDLQKWGAAEHLLDLQGIPRIVVAELL